VASGVDNGKRQLLDGGEVTEGDRTFKRKGIFLACLSLLVRPNKADLAMAWPGAGAAAFVHE
jgi:hypothetical protein